MATAQGASWEGTTLLHSRSICGSLHFTKREKTTTSAPKIATNRSQVAAWHKRHLPKTSTISSYIGNSGHCWRLLVAFEPPLPPSGGPWTSTARCIDSAQSSSAAQPTLGVPQPVASEEIQLPETASSAQVQRRVSGMKVTWNRARAKERRACWPPDSITPRLPTKVLSPCGSAATSSVSAQAWSTRSYLAVSSGRPKVTLSLQDQQCFAPLPWQRPG